MKTSPVICLALVVFATSVSAREAKRTTALGKALDAPTLARAIDAGVQKQLDARKLPTSPRTTDEEFLRRVYLDVAGVIPTAKQATAFLDGKAPDKRARLIDTLLASPEHARQIAAVCWPADWWKPACVSSRSASAAGTRISRTTTPSASSPPRPTRP